MEGFGAFRLVLFSSSRHGISSRVALFFSFSLDELSQLVYLVLGLKFASPFKNEPCQEKV